MKVLISIPAYNEEKTIGNIINETKEVMSKTKYDYEILVLDDGSTDGTVKVAKDLGVLVFSNSSNLGLAETFKKRNKKIS